MVMLTRSYSNRASENSTSGISEKNVVPPWCSSRRVYERRKPRKVVPRTKSFYPQRENICEILSGDKPEHIDVVRRNNIRNVETQINLKRYKWRNGRLLAFLVLPLALMVPYLTPDSIFQKDLITKILPNSKFLSIDSTSVGEECCYRMRHLTLALRRAEQALSKAFKVRKMELVTQNWDTGNHRTKTTNNVYIEGTRAFRGSNTVEWETQMFLWGVVPLTRTGPPPDVILSSRRPVPSDCWPIRGSYGEVIIELPTNLKVDILSLEHIRPDTAYSAPKNFTVYGVLVNGTLIKTADAMYQYDRPPKQYYHLDNRNAPLQKVIFRILSNQGNPNYTCIYRVNLYSNL